MIVMDSGFLGNDARTYDFCIESDLYLFFRFESPRSDCVIGIGFDRYVDDDGWYIHDGEFDWETDREIVDDVIDELQSREDFKRFYDAVGAAADEFNEAQR